MQRSKYGLPTLSMDERRDELHGFTTDRVKELCGAKHIKVYGKTKDVLIELLYGHRVRGPLDVLKETWSEEWGVPR